MSKTTYELVYDIDRDIWNWYYGANYSDNSSQFDDADDKNIAKQITGIERLELADPILRPYLQLKYSQQDSQLNKFIEIAKKEFSEKFDKACDVIEKMTSREIAVDNFIFYITTFPRMVVFYDEGIIFSYAKIDNELWGMPIDGFLHEVLHFQFEKYWRQDEKSAVSKLSEDDYFKLKESLTVILDEELKPIITLPDCSYPEFINLRNKLHEYWKLNQNFDDLIKFGLDALVDDNIRGRKR